ncbi:hypothetical protein PBI_TRISCUIT_47 [Microbacterium phage Triscuit]|nr:hypothetical protein PBI_TRISCUIT_47 [Microbacterium phage Triscuit]
MATPRKTAKAAEQLRVSQIGDFRERLGGLQKLPSGLVVTVRNPGGLTAFIANGTIPNSLLKIVQTAMQGEQTKEDLVAKATDLSKDMDSIKDMMSLMNIVTAQVIVNPPVRMTPTEDDVTKWNILHPDEPVNSPQELRDEANYLYVDEIEELDKQFLFAWVSGGTRDLEKFLLEHQRNVDAVSAEQGSQAGAKSHDGADAG